MKKRILSILLIISSLLLSILFVYFMYHCIWNIIDYQTTQYSGSPMYARNIVKTILYSSVYSLAITTNIFTFIHIQKSNN